MPETQTAVDPGLLARLSPLSRLTSENLATLAESGRVEELVTGQVLNAEDHQDELVYLLQGELIILRTGQNPRLINATDAIMPLFAVDDTGLRLVARNPATVLRIARALYDRLNEPAPEVREVDADGEEVQLIYALFNAYREGQLDLPSLPDVALEIRDAASNPDIGVAEIAEIVQRDPALTVRLIQAANSPAMRGRQGITSVRDAVVRLGVKVTRELALFLSLRSLFQTESTIIRQRMNALYQHSNRIAAVCHVLAGRVKGFEPERALLAGLVHDIGVIPILSFVNARATRPPAAAELDHAISNLRGVVGGMVLGQWGFEPDLVAAAESAEEWTRDSATPDYCDLVIMAQLLDSSLDEAHGAGLPAPQTVPAYHNLGLDALERSDGREAFIEEVTIEIAQVQESLG